MDMNEHDLREKMVFFARSLFQRGLTGGASGNMSVRLENGYLITPTNSCFGNLVPDEIAFIDNDENHVSGKKPSKEFFMHRAFYKKRPNDTAAIHLHSTYATALSCIEGVDPADALPAITPYSIMRFGKLVMVPYFRPGDKRLAEEIEKVASDHNAVLLANHGPVVSDTSLEKAIYAMEELEETAKVNLLLKNEKVRYLTEAQVQELIDVFVKK